MHCSYQQALQGPDLHMPCAMGCSSPLDKPSKAHAHIWGVAAYSQYKFNSIELGECISPVLQCHASIHGCKLKYQNGCIIQTLTERCMVHP